MLCQSIVEVKADKLDASMEWLSGMAPMVVPRQLSRVVIVPLQSKYINCSAEKLS